MYPDGINVRLKPEANSPVTGEVLAHNQIVHVDERVVITGVANTFLRLSTGAGWISERAKESILLQQIGGKGQ